MAQFFKLEFLEGETPDAAKVLFHIFGRFQPREPLATMSADRLREVYAVPAFEGLQMHSKCWCHSEFKCYLHPKAAE